MPRSANLDYAWDTPLSGEEVYLEFRGTATETNTNLVLSTASCNGGPLAYSLPRRLRKEAQYSVQGNIHQFYKGIDIWL